MSHHSHMLSQAYSVFHIKAACDPPAVEKGRKLLGYPLRSQPNQVTRLKAKGRQPSLPVLAHCERALQGMQLLAALGVPRNPVLGRSQLARRGHSFVCFVVVVASPPTHPLPKAQWSDCVPC